MNRVTVAELRPGLSVKQLSTNKVGVITAPPAGASVDLGRTWVDFGRGPESIRDDDIDLALRRVRLTIRHNPDDPTEDFKQIAKLRRDLQTHSPVEVDPSSPATQTHRDTLRNAYFEFATEFPDEVRRVLRQFRHEDRVTMQDLGEVGLVCTRCGCLSGFVTLCPNCHQRDIDPCPNCHHEIFRERYESVGSDLFVCPDCGRRVRLEFNELDKSARSVGEPVVLVKDAGVSFMQFDAEGHVHITPREWQERLHNTATLTRDVWLVGTPWAFPTYASYREFMAFLSDRLGVHANNVAVRGSTKVGFSISPKLAKVWMSMRPDSDLDLAIVDPDYYHFFDREIRAYERRLGSQAFRKPEYLKTRDRRENRRFYVYRYMDMPDIGCVRDHKGHLDEAPLEQCCGIRPLTAFIYRDWWSVQSRCEYDLRELQKALAGQGLPAGGDSPRPFGLMTREEAIGLDAAAVTERRCDRCGGQQELDEHQRYVCPRCDRPPVSAIPPSP